MKVPSDVVAQEVIIFSGGSAEKWAMYTLGPGLSWIPVMVVLL